jgi:hypothetical protein
MKNSSAQPNPNPVELDLPDWSGMVDSGIFVDAATAFRLCEEYATRFPEILQRFQKERLEQKCVVEFRL